MKRKGQWAGALGALALGVAGFVALHVLKPEAETVRDQVRLPAVFVDEVRTQTVPLGILSQGEVRARAEMDLVAEVSGRVVAVAPEFVAGGVIEPGAVLLTIEDADYRHALTRAESAVAEARMRIEQVRAESEVARRQLDPRTATPLGLRKPQLADAEARLRAAEAELATARLDLARTRVSLPFRGHLREVHVNVGQFVAVGTPLGRAFSTDVAEVRLPLTDQQLGALGLPLGYRAGVGEGAAVEFSATVGGEVRGWHGRLARLDAAVDPDTRVVYAVAEVGDPYGAAAAAAGGMPFAVGMFVDARIAGREMAGARVIPRDALRSGEEVYVVQDGVLDIRRVRVLQRDADSVVVGAGLEPGERVVVSPVRSAVDGMRVESQPRAALAGEETQVALAGGDAA